MPNYKVTIDAWNRRIVRTVSAANPQHAISIVKDEIKYKASAEKVK